jgi:hypothetical protein
MIRHCLSFLLLALTAVSCVEESFLDVPAERMLQVDAVFYLNAPLPVIQVRHAFKATGNEPFQFNRTERWTLGANVQLRAWNPSATPIDTIVIALTEVQPGRFRPLQTSLRVMQSMHYEVHVTWDGLTASAKAVIPRYDRRGLSITNENPRFARRSIFRNLIDPSQVDSPPIADTLDIYASRVKISYTATSAFMAVQYGTDHEFIGLGKYLYFDRDLVDPSVYRHLYLDERNPRFELSRDVFGLYPYLSSIDDREPATLRVVVVVPEDIYADYARTDGDFLLPATPTNVKNGVGLFIGAVRDTVYYVIPFFLDP